MKGIVYKTFVNDKKNTMELFCNIVDNKSALDAFQPFTSVETYTVINSTSLSSDVFGFDIFPFINTILAGSRMYAFFKNIF
jgi:hypothetical protein